MHVLKDERRNGQRISFRIVLRIFKEVEANSIDDGKICKDKGTHSIEDVVFLIIWLADCYQHHHNDTGSLLDNVLLQPRLGKHDVDINHQSK